MSSSDSHPNHSSRRILSLGLLSALLCGSFAALSACGSDTTLNLGSSSSTSSSGQGGQGGGAAGAGGEIAAGGAAGMGGMGGSGGMGGAFQLPTVPVLLVHTNAGAEILEDVKVDAQLEVIEEHDGTLQDLSMRPRTFNGPVGIEIRGSTSAGFPKKSYGMETRDATGLDLNVSLLGMPAESDWVLHGPYSDKTLMRNKLTYDLGRAMGRYAPRTRFVELFVNDTYKGVYVFLEKIKRDAQRVNIPKVATSAALGDITGGYIVKLEAGNANGGWFSAQGTAWQYHYPRFDQVTAEQTTYLQTYIDSFEAVMFGPDFADPVKGYQAWIDIPSFVDFAIINELGRNVDGYRKSTYMYKQSDTNGGLMYMGPLWDFNLAFGNADYCDGARIDEFVYQGGNCAEIVDQIPKWWYSLMADPVFTKALRCRWESLRADVLSDASIGARIDGYWKEIALPELRDHLTWDNLGIYVWPNAYVGSSYADEIAYIKQWTVDRAAWLDGNMPGTCL